RPAGWLRCVGYGGNGGSVGGVSAGGFRQVAGAAAAGAGAQRRPPQAHRAAPTAPPPGSARSWLLPLARLRQPTPPRRPPPHPLGPRRLTRDTRAQLAY